jgi:nucleoside-diphosphate-sugar epimerase
MKKILITGGAGFIGFNLVKALSEKYKITIVDNLSRGKKDNELIAVLKKKNVNLIKINLRKQLKIKNNFDYVYHLAATVGVNNVIKDPIYTFRNNLESLFNIISFCKLKKKTKLIFFSTSEVYSPLIEKKLKNIFPLKENYDMLIKKKNIPRDSYYLSKLFSEKIIELSGLKYIIYRPHNIYGPRMGTSHVIPELINKIVKNKNTTVKIYSPSHKRVFCFIDDCIFQIISTCFKKKFLNQIINLGSTQKEIKIFDLAKIINNFSHIKKILLHGPITSGSPKRRIPSLQKISKEIKNYNQTKLVVGIKKTLDWYAND